MPARRRVGRSPRVCRTSCYSDPRAQLAPGNDALRPQQATPIAGLTLAGDYTRQPYIATMEGAVVSGQLAAAAVEAAYQPVAFPAMAGADTR